jgi:hypothetical protein
MTDTETPVDVTNRDFFKDPALFVDPNPYYDVIRA